MLPLHSVLHEQEVQGSKYSQDQRKPKCGTSVPFSALTIRCFTTFLIKNTYSFKIKLIFSPWIDRWDASEVFFLIVSLLDGQAINALMKIVNIPFSSLFNKIISHDLNYYFSSISVFPTFNSNTCLECFQS